VDLAEALTFYRVWLRGLDVDAWARLWGGLVVVLLPGLRFLWSDVRLGEHLEGVTGRHQPGRVIGLLDRAALGCRCLLEG
jgi:hypothetical protein